MTLRDFTGSIGLLRTAIDDREHYWVRRDCSGRYALPMGQQLEGESFRETAEREIGWTFGLERGREFIVSSVPRLHYGTSLTDDAGEKFEYGIEFFVADTYGRRVRKALEADERNVLVDAATLLDGGLADGRLDEEQRRLLVASDPLSRG